MASVFVNRLKRGMRLQTDPTVIYGITEGKGALGRGLRATELAQATPYNTYVRAGLPPTPIANPGKAAIEAAADPEPDDFLYFVADGTGGHAFARTLEEHNRNVANWRRIEGQRAAEAGRRRPRLPMPLRRRRGAGAGGGAISSRASPGRSGRRCRGRGIEAAVVLISLVILLSL